MFSRILFKSFTINLRRKLMAIISIAMGASLIVVMLNLWLDVGDKLGKELKSYGSNIVVKPKSQALPFDIGTDVDPLEGRSFIDESDLLKIKTIFWANNIVAFAPYLETKVKIDGRDYPVIGTWFNKKLVIPTGETIHTGVKAVKPWWEVKGSWISEQSKKSQGSALIGQNIAKKLNLKPGDSLPLIYKNKNNNLRVSGVVKAGGLEDTKIFVRLDELQKIANLPGKVGWVDVSALTVPENELARKYEKNPDSLSSTQFEKWYCTAFTKSIAFQIEEVIRGSEAKPLKQVADSESFILNKIQFMMTLLAVLAFVSSWLGVWSLMGAGVLERSKEVGLSKAIGASDLAIIALFITEASLVGLIGGLVGYFAGSGLAQLIGYNVFGRAIDIKIAVAPIAVMISVAIALLGNLSIVSTIVRLKPKDILHGA